MGASPSAAARASFSADKLNNILSFLDQVEAQAEQEAAALVLSRCRRQAQHCLPGAPLVACTLHRHSCRVQPPTSNSATGLLLCCREPSAVSCLDMRSQGPSRAASRSSLHLAHGASPARSMPTDTAMGTPAALHSPGHPAMVAAHGGMAASPVDQLQQLASCPAPAACHLGAGGEGASRGRHAPAAAGALEREPSGTASLRHASTVATGSHGG